MAYCKFCGAEIPEGQQTCPKCTQAAPNGEEKKRSRAIHDVIWPKGGGSHPAARLLRILAQVTFWGGLLSELCIWSETGFMMDLIAILYQFMSFLPAFGILLGLAEVIELLDQRKQV